MNIFEDLVTFDQIRYAAGVADVEIGNEELENSGLDQELALDMAEWLPDSTSIEDIYADAIAPAATSDDLRKQWAAQAYAKYYVALRLHLLGTVRFAKSITDSENAMAREARKNEDVIENLKGQARYYKSRLLALLGEPLDTAASFDFMGISSPSYDPITG